MSMQDELAARLRRRREGGGVGGAAKKATPQANAPPSPVAPRARRAANKGMSMADELAARLRKRKEVTDAAATVVETNS